MPAGKDFDQLPRAAADRLTHSLARFLRIESVGGAVLLLAALTSLIVANSPWAQVLENAWETRAGLQLGSLEFVRPVRAWINDGLMTLFFFLVALELKRELVLGELRNPHLAALSFTCALGGMLVPAALYLALQSGSPGAVGWGVVMTTDTAFVVGCLALLRSRIPVILRVFMLSLAIVDDIGAILVVAIGYSSGIVWEALAVGMFGVAVVGVMTLGGIRSVPAYFLVGGLIWLAVDASGIHPTITGVILGLLTPTRRWVNEKRLSAILDRVVPHSDSDRGSGDTRDQQSLRLAATAARESLSPVERLEMLLHPWVGLLIMPVFALANAGLPLSNHFDASVTLAVLLGLAVGKPLGILSFCGLALCTGIAKRPAELGWRLLAGGSALAGIGFTMALFIANLAFDDDLIDSAKLGILLASIVSAATGVAILVSLPARRK